MRKIDNTLCLGAPLAIVSFSYIDLGDDLKIHTLGELTKLLAHSSCRTYNCNFHNSNPYYFFVTL